MMPVSLLKLAVVAAAMLAFAVRADVPATPLGSRFAVGDSYALSLSSSSTTEVHSSEDATGKAFGEDVDLTYTATVVVLEVDADGRPVRERHDGVSLTFKRPGESGSLFKPDTSYEVDRRDGAIRIFFAGKRIERRIEKKVAALLGGQFEYTLAPALLALQPSVDVGHSWALDRNLARALLRQQGLRVVEFSGTPTATLKREPRGSGGSELVIYYDIPIAWFEPKELPANAKLAASEAHLNGELHIPDGAGKGALVHSSHLELSLHGAVKVPNVLAQSSWSLKSSKLREERSELLSRDASAPEP
jgi:hypothetical protein